MSVPAARNALGVGGDLALLCDNLPLLEGVEDSREGERIKVGVAAYGLAAD
jgi:hypothetical protein